MSTWVTDGRADDDGDYADVAKLSDERQTESKAATQQAQGRGLEEGIGLEGIGWGARDKQEMEEVNMWII